MSQTQKLNVGVIQADLPAELPNSDFTSLLRSRRNAEIEAFLIALGENSLQQAIADDDAFSAILDLAIGDYGVLQKDLASHLGVSPSAVGRWRANDSVPPAFARPPVIAALAALVAKKLSDEEPKAPEGRMREHA